MKLLVLSTLIALSSCGPAGVTGNALNEERDFNPLRVDSELSRISSLCSALSAKASRLALSQGQIFNYDLSQSNCSGEDTSGPVSVVLEISGSEFRQRRTDNGLLFIFPDMETHQSGIMKELCGNTTELTNPKLLSSGNALWFKFGSSSECSGTSQEICVTLETGIPSKDKYKIVSREAVKFSLQTGLFNQRTLNSTALCSNGQITATATLK